MNILAKLWGWFGGPEVKLEYEAVRELFRFIFNKAELFAEWSDFNWDDDLVEIGIQAISDDEVYGAIYTFIEGRLSSDPGVMASVVEPAIIKDRGIDWDKLKKIIEVVIEIIKAFS